MFNLASFLVFKHVLLSQLRTISPSFLFINLFDSPFNVHIYFYPTLSTKFSQKNPLQSIHFDQSILVVHLIIYFIL